MQKSMFNLSVLAFTFIGLFSSCNKDDDNTPTVTVTVPSQLSISNAQFFPEDIAVYDNKVYVSGYGDGSIQKFDITQTSATAQQIASAEGNYTASWGLRVDESKGTLLNLANAPYYFNGTVSAPCKVNAYKLSDNSKINSWTLPSNTVGNSIIVANGYYYIGDIGPNPRIIRLDPNTGTTTIKTDPLWAATGFGFGGIVYGNNGIYGSLNGKLWYVPIDANGNFGTVSKVAGVSNVYADGMTWAGNNTIYYCENDAQNPANVGKVWKVSLSSNTAGTVTLASIPNNGSLNNPSGIFYKEINNKKYLFVNESQIFNTPTLPFKVNIFEVQ